VGITGRRRHAGLILGELLALIAVLGALTVVAAFAFVRYAAQARTSEAMVSLGRIGAGAANYFNAEHVEPDGTPAMRQFPTAAGPTPIAGCCTGPIGRCTGGDPGWTQATWQLLQFSMDRDHYYTYDFVSAGTNTAAVFTAMARGNLDCDGDETLNWVIGYVNLQNEVEVRTEFVDDQPE